MNSNVVYICSDVRSGSTLLDMMLGRHPLLASVGELHHLHDYLNGTYYRQKTKEDKCTCGKTLYECPFWSKVIAEYKSENNTEAKVIPTRLPPYSKGIRKFLFDFYIAVISIKKLQKRITASHKYPEYIAIADNRFKLYEAINTVCKTSFVVDSSKNIVDMKFLLAAKTGAVKTIFLTRDLRALATSKVNRQASSTFSFMVLHTMLFHIRLFFSIGIVPRDQRLIVRYEDVVKDADKQLTRIFSFLKISDNVDLNLQAYSESHVLGGSPHRLTNKSLQIYVDERWKEHTSFSRKMMNDLLLLTSKIFMIKVS